ncbi:hypothetical protein GOV13_01865 [Candidatus Pacearchaeota archaeon]|nr:hypothetical protein [Candidatus Pacearchaeota archaeon]
MKKSAGLILIVLVIAMAAQISAFEFCDDGVVREKDLRLISVDDMLEENTKEWIWQTEQNIELELRVENREDESRDYVVEAVLVENDNDVDTAQNDDNLKEEFSLSADERKTISLHFEVDEDIDEGEYLLFVKFYEKGDENDRCVENGEEIVKIKELKICPDGNVDEDDLEIERISDRNEDNDEDWVWAPGNDLVVSIDFSNKDYSERDFIVELIMLDEEGTEVEFAESPGNVMEDTFLEEGDEEDILFEFTLNSLLTGEDYSLYARFYDEDDEDICTSLKAENKDISVTIEIEKEDNNVVVTKVEGPNEAETGSEVNYVVKIVNLGKEDEKRARVVLYSRILNITKIAEIDDLESGEEAEVNFSFRVLDAINLSTAKMTFSTDFDYNSNSDVYKKESDDNDNVDYFVNVIPKEITEESEPIVEEENTTIEELLETSVNPETTSSAPITGAAIGSSNKSSSALWISVAVLLVAGAALFLRQKQKKKDYYAYGTSYN